MARPKEIIDFNDHRTRAAVWGEAAIISIKAAIANPHPTTTWDLDGDHAVRCARLAAYHAFKVLGKPKEDY